MNHFSERVKEKKRIDHELLRNSAASVYDSISSNSNKRVSGKDQESGFAGELARILDFFQMGRVDYPEQVNSPEETLQYAMSSTGLLRRKVILSGNWWKEGSTPLLCDTDQAAVALLPVLSGGYCYYLDGKMYQVTETNAKQFKPSAYCFYKPFENKALKLVDFWKFLFKSITMGDVLWLAGLSLVVGLLGLVLPTINRFIFNNVVPSGTSKELFGIASLLIGTAVISSLFALARLVWVMRVGNKIELTAQGAVWARLMNLPVDFFKQYDSGELTQRAASINQICGILSGGLIPTALGSLFSFIYLFQISSISGKLMLPSFLIIALMLTSSTLTAYFQIKMNEKNNQIGNQLSSLVFQLLNGIMKIKVAGAEVRSYAKWAELYSKVPMTPNLFLRLSGAVNAAISFGGIILLYGIAYRSGMSASDYIAFSAAFGSFSGAVLSLAGLTQQVAAIKPSVDMIRPIIEAEPENAGVKQKLDRLTGAIEVNQVKFRYHPDMPYVLNELSITVRPGEYVGLVGSSGCGKSTLFRILLGFEVPESGSVYYDMHDLNGLDLRSVRQRIGVVLQNGKLFSGDIYSNIVICAPWLTVDEAWVAAERSGFAEDIRQMPMGMFTMVSEGGGGLSGGQQQRLLIARALASNPDIVMFDEATSALDNLTQALVVNTLEQMDCTRLVIAHRLSTIRNCSRIIYLHQGRVAEEGTYEELMALDGMFAQMAKRQLV